MWEDWCPLHKNNNSGRKSLIQFDHQELEGRLISIFFMGFSFFSGRHHLPNRPFVHGREPRVCVKRPGGQ